MKKTVYLFRHGEVDENFRYCCKGTLDCELSEEGKAMSEVNMAYVKSKGVEKIITTGLRRTDWMGKKLHERFDVPHEIREGFREINMGIWEGKTWQEIETIDPKMKAMFYADPLSVHIQGGEEPSVFSQRVIHAWGKALQDECTSLAIVAHAVVNTVLLAHIKNKKSSIGQNAAALNLIEINDGIPSLILENQILY